VPGETHPRESLPNEEGSGRSRASHVASRRSNAATQELLSNSGVGKRLLNVEEASAYLGLKVDTVYKKARLRELPCVKVGRSLRFDIEALQRFIEQHTIETID
jgi:excisionase family DNA binding protein